MKKTSSQEKLIKELVEFYLKNSKQTNKFRIYSFLFLASFVLESEFKAKGIDLDEFRREMLEQMEEELLKSKNENNAKGKN